MEQTKKTIFATQASTVTIVEQSFNEGNNFPSPKLSGERNEEQLALKLNLLKEKCAR